MDKVKTKQKVYSTDKLRLIQKDFVDNYFIDPNNNSFICEDVPRQFFILPPNTTTIWVEVSLQQWPDKSGYKIRHTYNYQLYITQCTQTNIFSTLFNWLNKHDLLGKTGYWRILYEE